MTAPSRGVFSRPRGPGRSGALAEVKQQDFDNFHLDYINHLRSINSEQRLNQSESQTESQALLAALKNVLLQRWDAVNETQTSVPPHPDRVASGRTLNLGLGDLRRVFDYFDSICHALSSDLTEVLTDLQGIRSPDRVEAREAGTIRNETLPSDKIPKDVEPPTDADIVFRAELYKLMGGNSRRDFGANLVEAFENDRPININRNEGSESMRSPIFEVITFLAAPKNEDDKKQRPRFASERSLYYSDSDDSHAQPTVIHRTHQVTAHADAGTVLSIQSQLLVEAIRDVCGDYPDLAFEGDTLLVPEPYCVLFHRRDAMLELRDKLASGPSTPRSSASIVDLQEELLPKSASEQSSATSKVSNSPDAEKARHISVLYKFLDEKQLAGVECERRRWRDNSTCTFEWAWLLFEPGRLVFERSFENEGSPQGYLVDSVFLKGLFRYTRDGKKPLIEPNRLDTRRQLKFGHSIDEIQVNLVLLEHDGRKWKFRREQRTIYPFFGEMPFEELGICPEELVKDRAMRDQILAHGKRYQSLIKRGQHEYDGRAYSGVGRRVKSRIIVDLETYHYDKKLIRKRKPNPDKDTERVRVRRRDPYDPYTTIDDESSSEDEITAGVGQRRNVVKTRPDDRRKPSHLSPWLRKINMAQMSSTLTTGSDTADKVHLICTGKLYAYVLNEAEWVLIDVDGVSPCKYDERLIDELQISDSTKSIIEAMANRSTLRQASLSMNPMNLPEGTSADFSADFIPNKGQGQILLLHGKPGVGKTSAAECVAELTHRPLVTVSCGELGSLIEDVETELTRWLRLAIVWNAILLFEEADVFLEARERRDITRNGIVSVFLRALEYYQGMIFMTSNRIGTFDEGILSRIHMILHFPNLTDEDRDRIWDTSFRKLRLERKDIEVDDSVRDFAFRDARLKELNWNGREIRNAFNTMVALAEFDAKNNRRNQDGKIVVQRKHLQTVWQTSKSFKTYMQALRGMSEADFIRASQLRADNVRE